MNNCNKIIPLSWDRKFYLDYCDSLMMVSNNNVSKWYRGETGFNIFSLSQLPEGIVRRKYISYFRPSQIVDIELYINK